MDRGLVDLFESVYTLVPTPKLLRRETLSTLSVSTAVPFPVNKFEAKKPPRSIALAPRASTQIVAGDSSASVAAFLQTSPSSPRRRPGRNVSAYFTPASSTTTPYSPRGAGTSTTYASSLFSPTSPASPTTSAMPPISPFIYSQNVSQSTPLPGDRRGSLTSSATTPAPNSRRLSSSISDRNRQTNQNPPREKKCILQ